MVVLRVFLLLALPWLFSARVLNFKRAGMPGGAWPASNPTRTLLRQSCVCGSGLRGSRGRELWFPEAGPAPPCRRAHSKFENSCKNRPAIAATTTPLTIVYCCGCCCSTAKESRMLRGEADEREEEARKVTHTFFSWPTTAAMGQFFGLRDKCRVSSSTQIFFLLSRSLLPGMRHTTRSSERSGAPSPAVSGWERFV